MQNILSILGNFGGNAESIQPNAPNFGDLLKKSGSEQNIDMLNQMFSNNSLKNPYLDDFYTDLMQNNFQNTDPYNNIKNFQNTDLYNNNNFQTNKKKGDSSHYTYFNGGYKDGLHPNDINENSFSPSMDQNEVFWNNGASPQLEMQQMMQMMNLNNPNNLNGGFNFPVQNQNNFQSTNNNGVSNGPVDFNLQKKSNDEKNVSSEILKKNDNQKEAQMSELLSIMKKKQNGIFDKNEIEIKKNDSLDSANIFKENLKINKFIYNEGIVSVCQAFEKLSPLKNDKNIEKCVNMKIFPKNSKVCLIWACRFKNKSTVFYKYCDEVLFKNLIATNYTKNEDPEIFAKEVKFSTEKTLNCENIEEVIEEFE